MLDTSIYSTTTTPAQSSAELAAILDRASTAFRSVVIFSPAAADICAAWCVHTWCYDQFDFTPRLQVTSPAPECGKTTLLESMKRLCCNATLTGNVTAAVIFRYIERQKILTLLLDESDSYFTHSEDHRGIANMGYSRYGHEVMRCERVGDKMEPKRFATFAPMAIGGIGRLPETIESRAIPIILARKRDGEHLTPLSNAAIKAEFLAIRTAISEWVTAHGAELPTAPPPLGHASGRKNDICTPLVAIGDAAGPAWGKRLRAALLAVLGTSHSAEDYGVMLLRDCRAAFASRPGDESLTSDDLLASLLAIDESPWAEFGASEYRTGRAITKSKLGRLLSGFGIHSVNRRLGSGVAKAYRRADFMDAWARYLPADVAECV